MCILREIGKDPGTYKLAFVDNTYTLATKLNPKKLVYIEDVTEKVEAILPEVQEIIIRARKTANAKRSPKKYPESSDKMDSIIERL